MNVVLIGVTMFATITLILVAALLLIRRVLIGAGEFSIVVNDDESRPVKGGAGSTLLSALSAGQVRIPAPCGGSATCGMCRVEVTSGGGALTSGEASHINRAQAREGTRLACMVRPREDVRVQVPPEIFSVRQWTCKVKSNRNVATFMKELVLELKSGEEVPFTAGGYIQFDCPPHTISYKDFDIPEQFRADWDKADLWKHVSKVTGPVSRAYSMANHPAEKGIIVLVVRIATPPASAPSAPPGKVSSYVFSLKPGDSVQISGPYGEFHAQDTNNEMVFIGGGAGIAPMRSHIFDQFRGLKTSRKVNFWYGARSLSEACYMEDFTRIQEEFPNFKWHLVLSEPKPEDNWTGPTGHVHKGLHDLYLQNHPAPEEVEYYLCGPPAMVAAVVAMLDSLGVEPENIFFDDFGG